MFLLAPVHVFDSQIDLPIGIEEVWAFFTNPHNLSKLTPPSLAFSTVSEHQFLREIYPGQIIVHKVTPFLGIPVAWMTEITQVRQLSYFVDEQRVGPFALWHHEHHFQTTPGGTRVRDIVHYQLPFGLIGDALGAGMAKRQLSSVFAYRRDVLRRRFSV